MASVHGNLPIDILDVKSAGLRGTKDPELLEIAAKQGRNMITSRPEHDDGRFLAQSEEWRDRVEYMPATR